MTANRNLSITHRFLLAGLVPAVVLALTLTGYLTLDRLHDSERRFAEQGESLSRELAAAAVYGLFVGDTLFLEEMTSRFLKLNERVLKIEILDDRLNVLVTATSDKAVAGDSTAHEDPRGLFVQNVRPPFVALEGTDSGAGEGALLGSVRVSLDTSVIAQDFGHIVGNSIVILIVGLLAFALWLRAASHRISDPLEKIVRTIRLVRENKLDARVPVRSSGELRVLEEGVNEMVTALAVQQDELERQIAEATNELSSTMEELEIRNAEIDLARKEAIRANNVKSQFLAHMSHEIRTPMNGILGFISLLRGTSLDAYQQEQIEVIEGSARDLLAIINDILDFSKIESGNLVLDKRRFELRNLVYETARLFSPIAADKGIELVVNYDDDVHSSLQGDAMRVRQVLVNLLSNALKFTERGHVAVRVSMPPAQSPETALRTLRLSVEDTGIGIEPDEVPGLFDAFHQAEAARFQYAQGTGLGLAITKSLVEAMGGRIDVDTRHGGPTTFTATLRLEAAPTAPSAADRKPPLRALLWDEVPLSREAMLKLLRQHDILPNLAPEAPGQEDDFAELVLIGVPAAASAARQPLDYLAGWHDAPAPVIVYGPRPDATTEQAFIAAGASFYLTKPVTPDALERALRSLDHRRADIAESPSSETATAVKTPAAPDARRLDDRRFLVADDNAINRRLLVQLLGQLGAEVTQAVNGADARDKAAEGRFDMILLDLHMPVMDGVESAKRIRQLPQHLHTPIIALTADALPESNANAMAAGIDQVLIKPLDADKLLATTAAFRVTANPTQEAPAAQLRDTDTAVRIAGGSDQLADELFAQFLEELPGQMKQIETAMLAGETDALKEALHQLKGAAAICGVKGLVTHLDRMRETLLAADSQGFQRQYEALQAMTGRLEREQAQGES